MSEPTAFSPVQTARSRLAAWAGCTRGNVAMIFGLVMPVLILLTVGGIDIHRATAVRANLQDALDAATLAAARSPYVDSDDLTRVGLAALQANLLNLKHIELDPDSVRFDLRDEEVLVASARVNVKALVANIVLPPYGKFFDDTLPVDAQTEVNRATKDIEVAMVLDITGSMAGQRLRDLQSAAKTLVDLVVQPDQTINRTRVALVPYSMGVNGGRYIDQLRGASRGPTPITAAAWNAAPSRGIGGISRGSQARVTANGHGLSSGQFVYIADVVSQGSGNSLASAVNGHVFRVQVIDGNGFHLQLRRGSTWYNLSTSSFNSYRSGGTVTRCLTEACEVVVTSRGHGVSSGEEVRIADVRGMTQINTNLAVSGSNLSHRVTRMDGDRLVLNGITAGTVGGYSSGGYVQCLEEGCDFYKFTNAQGNERVFFLTDCVSERVGGDAYTDAASSRASLGRVYSGTTNVGMGGCMGTTFTPLTSDKRTLTSAIDGYVAEGGTAGQVGVGWGWYMISPTFASLFPAANRPDAYGTKGLLKVAILMTDGEFNAIHCQGVRARDSGVGGGSPDRQINCNGTNGDPFGQAVRMCSAMKARGIIIYTVGFDVQGTGNNTPAVDSAKEVMEACASEPRNVFLPENGASLQSAFGAIGRSISQLRISK